MGCVWYIHSSCHGQIESSNESATVFSVLTYHYYYVHISKLATSVGETERLL